MLTISDVAVEKAKEILSAEGKDNFGLRLYMAGSSCCGPSFGIDVVETPEDGDSVVEKGGLKVFVDPSASAKLMGMELDFIDDGDKQGFMFTGNPPASSCGSGSGSGCSSCG
ncbi:MAG: iron-sulfur cluster assembly accessory protein [Thermodesulfovibrionia bacterium]|nr:iron-sulfur cluster assembly accessory protein [Thermodesulfovibrionia bacterium]